MIKTGDLYFVSGESWISRLIKWITKGKKSHVGIVFKSHIVFETDGKFGKAKFFPLSKYRDKNIVFRRLKTMNDQHRLYLQSLCRTFEGAPYSYWDLVLNFVAAPLPDKARHWFVAKLGNKHFMRCCELSQRIIYDTTGLKEFENYEKSNPAEMFKTVEKSGRFEAVQIK